MTSAERLRVESFGHPEDGIEDATPWYRWGPYLSERQWGTVREDYSAHGTAWDYFPHEHARSRAYRWGEDGMAGICDVGQELCLALALWNGRDPILKERMFGLTGPEGNHGEDAKEHWWYLDALPSHAWLQWRYHYPQAEFPYADLVAENGRRGQREPEYELMDTGVFDDDRYWVVDVVHAKGDQDDLLMEISVTNAGPEAATIHVLPHLWFRNTWSWSEGTIRPSLRAFGPDRVAVHHPQYGELVWQVAAAPDGTAPNLLFCENETNAGAPLRLGRLAPVPEGRHQRPRRGRHGDGEPRSHRDEVPRRGTRSPSGRARPRSCGCACGRRRSARSAPGSTRCSSGDARKPTSSTPS